MLPKVSMRKFVIFFLLLFHLGICIANDGYCSTGYFNPLSRKSEHACFKLYESPKTFNDAQKFCKSVGGYLAEDVNQDDSSLYSASADIMTSPAKQYWIGASNTKCNFAWNSGSKIEFNGLWAKDAQFYGVAVDKLSDGGLWHTTPVAIQLPFVCTFKSSKNISMIGVPPTSAGPRSAPRNNMRAPIRKRVKTGGNDLSKKANAANKTEAEDDLDESMKMALANELANQQKAKNKTDPAAQSALLASKEDPQKKQPETSDGVLSGAARKNLKKPANESSDPNVNSAKTQHAQLNNKNKNENADETNLDKSASLNNSKNSKSKKSDEASLDAAMALSASKSNNNKTLSESEDSKNAAMSASMSKKNKSSKNNDEKLDSAASMNMAMYKKNRSSTSQESDDSINALLSEHSKKKLANQSESDSEKNLALAKSMNSKKLKLEESSDDKSMNAAMSMSKKNKLKSESESDDEKNAATSLSLSKKSKSKSEIEDEQNALLKAQFSKSSKNKKQSEDEMNANANKLMSAQMKKKTAQESESEDNLARAANMNLSKKKSSEDNNAKDLNASKNTALSNSSKKKNEMEDDQNKKISMSMAANSKLNNEKKNQANANATLNLEKNKKDQDNKEDHLDLSQTASKASKSDPAKKKQKDTADPNKPVGAVGAVSSPTSKPITTTKLPTINDIPTTTPPVLKQAILAGLGKPSHTTKLPTINNTLTTTTPVLKQVILAGLGKPSRSEPVCPAEYTQYSTNSTHEICFKKFENPMTFEEARMFCIDQGGHLASIHNQKQLLLLSALLHNDKPNTIDNQTWIGLNRIHQKYYVYEDETAMDFTRWLPGAPNINDCTVFTGNELPNYPHQGTQYKFGDYPCEKKQSSVLCEVVIGKGSHKKAPTCQNGWSYFSHDGKPENGKCYKQIVKETKFEDARLTCKAEDAYVATVHNLAESRFVSSLVDTSSNYSLSQQTWIGLVKYKDGNREYEWEDDHSGIQFNPWTEKLPQDKNCAVFTGNELPIDCRSKFRFVSVDCGQPQRAVLCHKPATTPKGDVFKFVDTHNTVRKI